MDLSRAINRLSLISKLKLLESLNKMVKWMSDYPTDYKPISYKRYLEVIFLLSWSELYIAKFLNYMDSKN